jgi:hypothetical protein
MNEADPEQIYGKDEKVLAKTNKPASDECATRMYPH